MASPFGPLLSLVRRAWWVFLVIAALLTALGIWHAIAWSGAEPVELGRGPAGSPVVISAELGSTDRLVVYGKGALTAERYTCRSDDVDHVGVLRDRNPAEVTFAGEQWWTLGTVSSSAVAGDVVFCPADGISEIVIVDDVAWRARLMTLVFFPAALAFAVGALVFRAIGRVSRD